jgi:transcription termination factor NusB
MINNTAEAIWKEYQKIVDYKSTIELFEDVESNHNFYLGKQWEGVNAPNIEKPVINILKKFVDYAVSMIISDDIAVSCDLDDSIEENTRDAFEFITTNLVDKVFEQTKFKKKTRKFVKDAAITGDAFFYWYYDPNKNKKGKYKGGIGLDIIESTNVGFGNPAEIEVDKQPYIIVITKLPTDEVKEMAKEYGLEEYDISKIKKDGVDYNQVQASARAIVDYTTVLTKFFKKDDTVWAVKSVQDVVIKEEWDTKAQLYPIAHMTWIQVENSYHGRSPLTETRQNQIMINKYYMMLNQFIKLMAFPKIVYDRTKIKEWNNKIGSALGVDGDPNQSFVSSTPTVQLSAQVITLIQDLIEKTKESLGIYDVVLGNVKPENTSAIIALQKTASQPLEFQRLEYLQVVEDSVRIIIDLMSAFYGTRELPYETKDGKGVIPFNFKDLDYNEFGMNVEVGQAAYWSEITQIQSLDNMFDRKIIPDAITYLEQLPNGILKNKNDIIAAIKQYVQEQQDEALAMQMVQQSQQGMIPNEMQGM